MKKIIKIIAFVTLIVCSIANANVAFAKCPRTSRNRYYEHYSKDCEWDYYNHKTIRIWAGRDQETKNTIQGAATIGGLALSVAPVPGARMAPIIGSGIGFLAQSYRTEAEKWVRKSEDYDSCGVKIHYCKNWLGKLEYKGFEPQ